MLFLPQFYYTSEKNKNEKRVLVFTVAGYDFFVIIKTERKPKTAMVYTYALRLRYELTKPLLKVSIIRSGT